MFHTSWDMAYRTVQCAVEWGLAHRDLKDVVAIGVDEIQWKQGHYHLTLVYQIDARLRRLLWVGHRRTEDALTQFFDSLEDAIAPTLQYVAICGSST